MILWDEARERDVTFEYAIAIPSLPTLQRGKKEADTQENKKPATLPKVSPGNGAVNGGGQDSGARGVSASIIDSDQSQKDSLRTVHNNSYHHSSTRKAS